MTSIYMRAMLAGAGLLAGASGGEAADLPVKAKVIEYLKVCAAYGSGYFYIPGTDTCIKIGGYVRADTYFNSIGTFIPSITSISNSAFNGPGVGTFGYPFRDADDPDYLTRARGVMDMDVRTQTDYGTLRSYIRFGVTWDSQQGAGVGPGNAVYFERAFVQISGFTIGYTQSFFDSGVNYMLSVPYAGSNQWTTLAAYTAQFGSGLSATLSLEDAANRVTGAQMTGATATPIFNINMTTTGLSYTNYQSGQQAPDIIGNLRIDQSWGSAQIAGALHQVTVTSPLYAGGIPGLASSGSWGWAIGGHVEVKLPMLAAGDSFLVQAGYADGAMSYVGMSGTTQGRSVGVGFIDLNQGVGGLMGHGAFYTLADAVATNVFGDYDTVAGWNIQGQYRSAFPSFYTSP